MDTPLKDSFILKSIGTLHTPFTGKAPRQSFEDEAGEFSITVYDEFTEGLQQLDSFTYIYVLYYLDKAEYNNRLTISPPLSNGQTVGLFASRSPDRPSPIGLSVVQIKGISNNIINISGIDAFDGTPVLDIKPYIDQLDSKKDANLGWIKNDKNSGHFTMHLKGIPH